MLEIDVGGGAKVVTTPKPASPKPTAAPQVISEHGQGGGSSSSDTGAKPTQQQTQTGAATPATTQPKSTTPQVISEHGQGGGSTSSDTGKKPTTQETKTGYATLPGQKSSVTTTTVTSEHGQGGGSGSSDTGKPPTLEQTRAGYTSSPTSRELQGLIPVPIISMLPLPSQTKSVWSAVPREAKAFASAVGHVSPKVLNTTEHVVNNAGVFIAKGVKLEAKFDPNVLEVKFGVSLVNWAKRNPAAVATIASVAAIVAPPPADLALGVLATVASGAAAVSDVKEHKYVAAAFDIAGAAAGVGGAATAAAERSAEVAHASTVERLNSLTKTIEDAGPDDVQPLTQSQRTSLSRLVSELNETRTSAYRMRTAGQKADLSAAVLAVVGEPTISPATRHSP